MQIGLAVILAAASPAFAASTFTEYSIPTASAGPFTITTGPDGALWFTETDAGKIGRITTSGTLTEYTLPLYTDPLAGGSPRSSEPACIVSAPDGNLWFDQGAANRFGRITPDGTVTNFPNFGQDLTGKGRAQLRASGTAPWPNVAYPQCLTLGPDGALWVADQGPQLDGPIGDGWITRLTTAGTTTRFGVTNPAQSQPSLITLGPDGLLWFTMPIANAIGKITTGGNITIYTLPTANAYPTVITAGPDGALWFTEVQANKIGRITTAGSVTEYNVPTASSMPYSIVTGPDGALWFTERSGNKLGRITTSGVVTEYAMPTANSQPAGITLGPDNALWYVAYGTNKIGKFTPGPIGTAIAPVYHGADGNQSFIRLGNGSESPVTFEIDIVGSPGGRLYGTASYVVPSLSSPQYGLNQITSSAGVSGFDTGDSSYSLYVRAPSTTGDTLVQHVIYNNANGFFENASACIYRTGVDYAGLNQNVFNVHTSRLAGYPSFIDIHNTNGETTSYTIYVLDSVTGAMIGSTPLVANAN
ncbi:MAG: Vgb family protein, partial [Rhodospirillaceae bacterium]